MSTSPRDARSPELGQELEPSGEPEQIEQIVQIHLSVTDPAEKPVVHLDPRVPDPPLRQAEHSRVGIDHCDFVDVLGIVRQVEPSPEADFQNGTLGVGQQFPAAFGQERPIQEEITKARKNDLRVQPHGSLLDPPSLRSRPQETQAALRLAETAGSGT